MEKSFGRWDGVNEGKPSVEIGWTSERMQSNWKQMDSHDQMKGRWNNREVHIMAKGYT